MSEEAETEPTKTPQPAQLRGKQNLAARFAARRTRVVDALATLNHYLEPHFDLGLLPRADWPDEVWDARMAKVMRALGAALRGEEVTPFVEAEAPEIQVDRLRANQATKDEYWQWNAAELRKLTEYLQQHPGHVITPHFAHSCEVKTPDGAIYHYHRGGTIE